MRYHDITKDDMNNGNGLRVVLWVSGCSHACKGCQNPITWNPYDGVPFDDKAKEEIFAELEKDYISGITFSGGDPLFKDNVEDILELVLEIKYRYPDKSIWVYTGYSYEDILATDIAKINEWTIRRCILATIDVLVDGEFVEALADKSYHWCGSTNQRVIDVQKSIKENQVVLWES